MIRTYFVSTSFGLVIQHLCTGFLSLTLVNMFHEDTLVLEHVTFHLHVQVVVQVTVDFLGFAVFFQ